MTSDPPSPNGGEEIPGPGVKYGVPGTPEKTTTEVVPGTDKPAAKDAQAQAAKDAKLVADIKQMIETEHPLFQGPEPKASLDVVEVKEDTVRTVLSTTFKDLRSLVTHYPTALSSGMGSRLLIDKDEQGKLRVAVSVAGSKRTRRMMIRQTEEMLTQTEFTGSWTFVMPGKVLSSSFGEVKDNTAVITIDSRKKDWKDAVKKILTDGIVIVSEPGKLKLDDLPLDSAKLAVSPFGPRTDDSDLPIADARPGFRVTPVAVTTSTVHYFDDAATFLGDPDAMMGVGEGNTCVVQARLHAPAGRLVLAMGSVRVIKAVDDQDREVKPWDAGEMGPGWQYGGFGMPTPEGQQKSVNFEIRLALPKQGAEAVEELRGQLVVTTFARWKQQAIGEIKPDPKVEIDLSDVLAGAKMVIKKVKMRKTKQAQIEREFGHVTLEVSGPPQVRRLDFNMRSDRTDPEDRWRSGDAYVRQDRSWRAGDKTVRRLTLQYDVQYDTRTPAAKGNRALVVRYPDDLKRERLNFTLQALDLF